MDKYVSAIVKYFADNPGELIESYEESTDDVLDASFEEPAKDPNGWTKREEYKDTGEVVHLYQHSYGYDGTLFVEVTEYDDEDELGIFIDIQ